jgi:hypothetical protein
VSRRAAGERAPCGSSHAAPPCCSYASCQRCTRAARTRWAPGARRAPERRRRAAGKQGYGKGRGGGRAWRMRCFWRCSNAPQTSRTSRPAMLLRMAAFMASSLRASALHRPLRGVASRWSREGLFNVRYRCPQGSKGALVPSAHAAAARAAVVAHALSGAGRRSLIYYRTLSSAALQWRAWPETASPAPRTMDSYTTSSFPHTISLLHAHAPSALRGATGELKRPGYQLHWLFTCRRPQPCAARRVGAAESGQRPQGRRGAQDAQPVAVGRDQRRGHVRSDVVRDLGVPRQPARAPRTPQPRRPQVRAGPRDDGSADAARGGPCSVG